MPVVLSGEQIVRTRSVARGTEAKLIAVMNFVERDVKGRINMWYC